MLAYTKFLLSWYSGCENIEVAPLIESDRIDELDPQVLNNTDKMRIHVFANDMSGQVILFAVYDNLGKGSSWCRGAESQFNFGTKVLKIS